MGRSQETFSKKDKEKNKIKKRQEKLIKKEERKANSKGGGLDNMMAYVDENGNISDTPLDPKNRKSIDAESIVLSDTVKDSSFEGNSLLVFTSFFVAFVFFSVG